MKANSELTSQILAYKELTDFDINISIDWALDMLKLGHDTPSLLILAGLSKPTNFFETEAYLISALKELDIQIPERDEAIYQYCKSFINKIALSENVKNNLHQLYRLAKTQPDDKRIFDFYLLYWAWGDLDYNPTYQHYWEGATLNNIESIVTDLAKKWIASN
jgi:hypothetical protein